MKSGEKTIPIRDKARNGERDAQFRGSDLAPELAALGSALVGATASREWGGGDDGKRMEKTHRFRCYMILEDLLIICF